MKTMKEKLDEAVGAAWAALMKSLTDNGVAFEDSDSGCYVDDTVEKKTYVMDIKLVQCNEYEGES
jgi:hypothetical protein